MNKRHIKETERAYLVCDEHEDRLASYPTESAAIEAAKQALAILGGGVIVNVDGSETTVAADPRVVAV